jgi:hypothetical protein
MFFPALLAVENSRLDTLMFRLRDQQNSFDWVELWAVKDCEVMIQVCFLPYISRICLLMFTVTL